MNIKKKIRNSGIRQWELAEALSIGETTLVRWLRRPEKLDDETINKINLAIGRLLNEKKNGGE